MSYQFDPRPEGLRYEPLKLKVCRQPVWVLRDGAPHVWVDLRSLLRALGVAYVRYEALLREDRSRYQLESCLDRALQETLLTPDGQVAAILARLLKGMKGTAHPAQPRVMQLLGAWPQYRDRLRAMEPTGRAAKPAATKQRKRKVDAFCVRQIFKLLVAVEPGQKPPTPATVAKALGISHESIRRVKAGTYPLDPAGLRAWQETFGAWMPPDRFLWAQNKVFEPREGGNEGATVSAPPRPFKSVH